MPVQFAHFYFVTLFARFGLPAQITKGGVFGIGVCRFEVVEPFVAIIGVAEIRLPVIAKDVIVVDLAKHIDAQVAFSNLLNLIGAKLAVRSILNQRNFGPRPDYSTSDLSNHSLRNSIGRWQHLDASKSLHVRGGS